MIKISLLCLSLFGAACAAHVGASGLIHVPSDATATCSGLCHDIGLPLGSVVIIADTVGCVCSAGGAHGAGEPATAGGMAALMVVEQRQQSSAAK